MQTLGFRVSGPPCPTRSIACAYAPALLAALQSLHVHIRLHPFELASRSVAELADICPQFPWHGTIIIILVWYSLILMQVTW